eukprot:SAG31_NODE_1209_length_9381_cov_2.526611_5_plen_86_part_00
MYTAVSVYPGQAQWLRSPHQVGARSTLATALAREQPWTAHTAQQVRLDWSRRLEPVWSVRTVAQVGARVFASNGSLRVVPWVTAY